VFRGEIVRPLDPSVRYGEIKVEGLALGECSVKCRKGSVHLAAAPKASTLAHRDGDLHKNFPGTKARAQGLQGGFLA